MPFGLDTPVFTVDKEMIHKVDTSNPHSLLNMWTSKYTPTIASHTSVLNIKVFSKNADCVLHGRRLEYMSWRYLNRATIRNKPVPETNSTATIDSKECKDTVESGEVNQNPYVSRWDQNPMADDFKHPFMSILEEDEPWLPVPLAQPPSLLIQRSGCTEESTSSADKPSPNAPSTTVIRGFSSATTVEVTLEQTPRTIAYSPAVEQWLPTQKPKQPGFHHGSSSSWQDDSAMAERMQKSQSIICLPQWRRPTYPPQNVMNESAIVFDSMAEGDSIDECAIDDDGSSDWEDAEKSSIISSIVFKRVDIATNLVSRPSLLTLCLEANRQQRRVGNIRSQSTSTLHRGCTPQRPQRVQKHTAQGSLSPQATRRQMVATELTESLRRDLVWERLQKVSTAKAVLKRSHILDDAEHLRQYPDRAYMDQCESPSAVSWDHYFERQASNGYHYKGW